MQISPRHSDDNNSPKVEMEPWGRLISLDPNIENVPLCKNIYTVGRKSTNSITIKNPKISSLHCRISRDGEGECWLKDFSLNGIYVEGKKVGYENKVKLFSGDIIHLLPQKSKKEGQNIGFVFVSKAENKSNLKRPREDERALKEELNQYEKKIRQHEEVGKEIICHICKKYIYQCVTVNPCLHNFCAACFSEWMHKSENCPECNQTLTTVKKNETMNSIINYFLEANQDYRRSNQEYQAMDQRDEIKGNTVIMRKQGANPSDDVTGRIEEYGIRQEPMQEYKQNYGQNYHYNQNNYRGYNQNYRGGRGNRGRFFNRGGNNRGNNRGGSYRGRNSNNNFRRGRNFSSRGYRGDNFRYKKYNNNWNQSYHYNQNNNRHYKNNNWQHSGQKGYYGNNDGYYQDYGNNYDYNQGGYHDPRNQYQNNYEAIEPAPVENTDTIRFSYNREYYSYPRDSIYNEKPNNQKGGGNQGSKTQTDTKTQLSTKSPPYVPAGHQESTTQPTSDKKGNDHKTHEEEEDHLESDDDGDTFASYYDDDEDDEDEDELDLELSYEETGTNNNSGSGYFEG